MGKRTGNIKESKEWKRFSKMSVANFIIIAFILVTTAMLAGFGIIDYKLEKDRQWNNLRKELSVTADQLKTSLTLPVWNLDKTQIEKIIESSMSNQNIYGIVINLDNNKYIRSRGADWEIVTPVEEFPTSGLLVEKRDIIYSGEMLSTIYLFGSARLVEENLKITFINFMAFFSVFVVIVIVGLYLVLHIVILKPVLNIERYTTSIISGKEKGLRIKGNYFQGELDLLRSSIEKMVNTHEDRFVELQTEVKLRTESEERFRTIFNSSNDALLICDENTGAILHVNNKTVEIFGYAGPEITQNNISIISADESRYNLNKAFQEAKKTSLRSYFGEFKARKKNGNIFWAEVSIKDMVIDHQNSALVAIRDITPRKQAEEDRRLSEEKYRNIVEKSVEGIYQATVDGKYLDVNPAMARLFGYDSPEDMIDSVKDIRRDLYVNPSDQDIFKNNLESNGTIEGFEAQYFRKDRKKIWVSLNARTVCDSGGQLLYYEGTAMDITLRKNAEEEKSRLETQLHQSQKMEALGNLAGGIAHDFNNILSVVLGFGSMLQEQFDKKDPVRKYVDQIVLASEKAKNLVSSLLAFSRKQPVQLQPVKLDEIIKGVEKLLLTSLTEDIALQINLSGNNRYIMGDITQIEQILFNLASNARDAMTGGGKLIIETKLMEVRDDFSDILGYGEPGTYALLSVADTGAGISEGAKEHIFDPFYTTKDVGKGTGLGLSTVYGIVKQHNGYITVYSEPGMGTVFHIYFPVLSASAEADATGIEPIFAAGGNETILVAEDDEHVRFFLNTVLKKYGYKVIEARDGEDAVQQYRANEKIDLMVIDSVMPKKNGREVYDEIKKDNPAIRALFISGYTRDIILDKGIEEKEVEFISKPLTQDAFLAKIRQILDSR
jgi:two-component system, cell cycle sensor histidine kinase and response regulator CckA